MEIEYFLFSFPINKTKWKSPLGEKKKNQNQIVFPEHNIMKVTHFKISII